jgi:RNA polymerase sigma-70 factor (ECF subfamily)
MGQDEPGGVRAELAGCLRPMIERLSKDYREAIVLVEFDGLTQQAAAGRLGISLPGMKSRVQRGRKLLRRMLDDCCLIELDRRGGVVDFHSRL